MLENVLHWERMGWDGMGRDETGWVTVAAAYMVFLASNASNADLFFRRIYDATRA